MHPEVCYNQNHRTTDRTIVIMQLIDLQTGIFMNEREHYYTYIKINNSTRTIQGKLKHTIIILTAERCPTCSGSQCHVCHMLLEAQQTQHVM